MSKAIKRVQNAAIHLDELADELQKEIDNMDNLPLADWAVYFWELKEAHTELETARKRVGRLVELLNKTMIPEKMDTEGTDKIRVPGIARSFYAQTRVSASIIDKERGFQWLRDNNAEELITETVNAGTLASHMQRVIIEEGIDPPEDIFKVTTYRTTGSSKYTPKESI